MPTQPLTGNLMDLFLGGEGRDNGVQYLSLPKGKRWKGIIFGCEQFFMDTVNRKPVLLIWVRDPESGAFLNLDPG
jgi:hypothetical protein